MAPLDGKRAATAMDVVLKFAAVEPSAEFEDCMGLALPTPPLTPNQTSSKMHQHTDSNQGKTTSRSMEKNLKSTLILNLHASYYPWRPRLASCLKKCVIVEPTDIATAL